MPWLATRSSELELPGLSYRDPSAATQSVSYHSPGNVQIQEWDAERAFKVAYLGNAVVYRCVQIIANDISTLPIRVGPDPDKPEQYRKNHPFGQMMAPPPGGPNPTLSSHVLLKHAIASLIVTGRFGWEIETVGNLPMRFWPLTTSKLHPIPSSGGSRWFDGFEYNIINTQQPKRLSPEQVHYQWFPGHEDFRQPESLIQAAKLDISVAIMQDQYDYSFLVNDARPASVIVHERFSEKAAQDEFRSQFEATHRGPTNKGKIAWMAHDPGTDVDSNKVLSIQSLALSHEDGQFIQRYKEKIRNITSALGVPMSKLDASGRTYDNANAEDRTYWIDTIRPLADFIAGNFSMDLLPRFPGSNSMAAWFDFGSIEQLKEKAKPIFEAAHVGDFLDRQIVTRNEVRKDYGLDPVPDGDKFEDPPDPLEATINKILPSSANGTSSNGSNDTSTSSNSNQNRRILKQLLAQRLVEDNGRSNNNGATHYYDSNSNLTEPTNYELVELRKLRVIRETEMVVDTLESKVERAFTNLFGKQESIVTQRLNSRRGKMFENPAKYNVEVRAITKNVFDFDYWRRITTELAHSLFEDVFLAGSLRIASLLGTKINQDQEYIKQFITERSNQLAGQVTNTTYAKIQQELSDGANRGETLEQLTNRVQNVFLDATNTRAKAIAQTEVNSAYNGAALEVAKSESHGDIVAQEWVTKRDSHVRDSHVAADGQVTLIGSQFNVGGIPAYYPGDPGLPAEEAINCRCTLSFLTANDITLGDLSGV